MTSQTCKRKRNRKPNSGIWRRNEAKVQRSEGRAYTGYQRVNKRVIHDTLRTARKMGAPCKSKECLQRKARMCLEISKEQRLKIFEDFWQKTSWDQKKTYVVCHVILSPTKRRHTDGNESRRNNTLTYHLTVGGEKLEVCKNLFLSTLGLGEKSVQAWVKNNGDVAIPHSKKHCNMI